MVDSLELGAEETDLVVVGACVQQVRTEDDSKFLFLKLNFYTNKFKKYLFIVINNLEEVDLAIPGDAILLLEEEGALLVETEVLVVGNLKTTN